MTHDMTLTMKELHLKMERFTRRDSHYCNKEKYGPKKLEEKELLRRIIRG